MDEEIGALLAGAPGAKAKGVVGQGRAAGAHDASLASADLHADVEVARRGLARPNRLRSRLRRRRRPRSHATSYTCRDQKATGVQRSEPIDAAERRRTSELRATTSRCRRGA